MELDADPSSTEEAASDPIDDARVLWPTPGCTVRDETTHLLDHRIACDLLANTSITPSLSESAYNLALAIGVMVRPDRCCRKKKAGTPLPTGVGKDARLWDFLLNNLNPMTQHHHSDPDLDGYVDWIVFDRSLGTFSEDCESLEEAQDLAARTGGGPIFQRQWTREPGTN